MAKNVTIRWSLPPDIVEGTVLDGKLLNAEAVDDEGKKVDGSYVYYVEKTEIYAVGDAAQQTIQPYSAPAGELCVAVDFRPAEGLTESFEPGNATRMTYVQPKDSDDLRSKPRTDLKASWTRLLHDPAIPGAVAELILASAKPAAGSGYSSPVQEQRGHAVDRIVGALKGTDAVHAAAEAPVGELIVEVWIENEHGKEEPLTRETLESFDLQVLDEYQSLAATYRVVEPGRIRYPEVRAGAFTLAPSAEIAGPDGDLDNDYQVRSAGSDSFEKKARVPYWNQTMDAKRQGQGPTAGGAAGEHHGGKPIWDKSGPSPFYWGQVDTGRTTWVRLKLKPRTAKIRCFSTLADDDGCSCSTGKQYVAQVPISVMRGEILLHSNSTGNSGSTAFKLSPGWYTFLAPRDISIDGCKYALCSSSPVSAFVGARQGCSDIHFCYGRKGAEIQVGTFVAQPTTSDPSSATVDEPLPDIQYLLLREGDDTFAQQQLASSGEAIFTNLPAGTYWLFLQAPTTYKSLPIKPIFPRGGRMALTTFAGQTSPIPVRARYTSLNAVPPAEFNGYVRDDDGNAMPQQLVKIVNSAGVVVAAALTDAQGYYSISIYEAENLRIVVGAQQQSVSRIQIAAALQATPALTRPRLAGELAQTSQDSLLMQDL